MFIPIILGTARPEARSQKVANFVYEEAKKFGFETELVRVGDYVEGKTYRLKDGNKKMQKWADVVSQSDALIIVSPEYNHSFPGELKIFLDSLYSEYENLPVGLCGVSSGSWGGVRMLEHLKPVLLTFKMFPLNTTVNFKNVKEVFDKEGNLVDDSYKERLSNLFKEIKKLQISTNS